MSDIFEDVGIAVVSLTVGIAIGIGVKTVMDKKGDGTDKKSKIVDFVARNKEYLLAGASVGVVAAKEAGRVIRDIRRTAEERSKNKRIYDHSTGKWIPLKREMTSYEHLMYDNRKRNGETASQILYDMGLLGR